MEAQDIENVVSMQRGCFPPPFPAELLWNADHLHLHLERFPEGQFVVDAEGMIVASASALIIAESTWQAHLSWEQTCGGFTFLGHDPAGTTLYAADISVDRSWKRMGLGRALYEARRELVRTHALARLGTACRVPGFADSGFSDPRDYAAAVAAGTVEDRVLTPLLHCEMQFLEVISDYMDDPESGDAAALLEWTP